LTEEELTSLEKELAIGSEENDGEFNNLRAYRTICTFKFFYFSHNSSADTQL